MSRKNRIVIAVLILWTLLHALLWSANGLKLSSCDGLWPFGLGRSEYVLPIYVRNSSSCSLHFYDVTEFILYVGMSWALLGVYHLVKHRENESPINVDSVIGRVDEALERIRIKKV